MADSSTSQGQGSLVLFLHGLESGPGGSKARYLQKHFGADRVRAPDLEMSSWDPRRSNSFTRTALRSAASLRGCAEIALRQIAVDYPLGHPPQPDDASGCASKRQEDVASGIDFQAVEQSLVIVGSSWGGAVAVKLVEEFGVRPKALVLMAPALGCKAPTGWLSMFGFAYSWLLPDWLPTTLLEPSSEVAGGGGAGGKVLLFHGTDDDTVPVARSRELKRTFDHIQYVEIAGGDHRLNAAMLEATEIQEGERVEAYPDGRLAHAVRSCL